MFSPFIAIPILVGWTYLGVLNWTSTDIQYSTSCYYNSDSIQCNYDNGSASQHHAIEW